MRSVKLSERTYNMILVIKTDLSIKAKKRITADDVVSKALSLMRGKRK